MPQTATRRTLAIASAEHFANRFYRVDFDNILFKPRYRDRRGFVRKTTPRRR